MGAREQRIAENETRFRDANEQLRKRWGELGLTTTELTPFLCECGDPRCTRVITMTLDEYEAVRSDPHTFAILAGHDDEATERVVGGPSIRRNERFAVVRKREEYRHVTEERNGR